jgi:putative ABC transport system permease protein
VVPRDHKAGTILRGRYIANDGTTQIVQPRDVVDGLLQNIFRIKNFIDGVLLVVGFATILALILVFALSLRLREREIQTIFKLGCSRMTIVQLMAAEIFIIGSASGVLCGVLLMLTKLFSNELVRMAILR